MAVDFPLVTSASEKMTKGELPIAPEEQFPTYCGNSSVSYLPDVAHKSSFNSNKFEIQNKGQILSDDINGNNIANGNVLEYCEKLNEHEENVPSPLEQNNNNEHINIAEYVNNLQSDIPRRTIARFLSIDDVQEAEIDIENIEHYLVIANRINSSTIFKVCEGKLISNLNENNCEAYYKTAVQYDLKQLRNNAELIKARKGSPQHYLSQNPSTPPSLERFNTQVCQGKRKRYKKYHAIFTCGYYGSKRTVTTVVYNNELRLKSYKDLQRGDKICPQFKCCCVQDDEENAPLVFWCFGSSVYRYDPLLNKCKTKASLRCKRSKFCMVAHSRHCYAIGGVYKSRKVLEIEEYVCTKKTNSWQIVARLPRECLPINSSCVVFNDVIYIFCSKVDDDNNTKDGITGVYAFNPGTKTVKSWTEIPFSFRQMKTCSVGSFIYIASDNGHFIRFSPSDGTCFSCADQILKCRDFGMFAIEGFVCLVGGQDTSEKYQNIICSFSTETGSWVQHKNTLPDGMTICDVCEVKIPNSAGCIVPFYETNVFEK